MKKKVSVYLKAGKRAATSYYRFYQYFDSIDADFKYNLMISDSKSESFFPIARQPKWKQVYIFFYIYIRVLKNLAYDIIRKPNYIVISRCIINKILPYSYIVILKLLKKNGCQIIWDFDDNIIGFEMSRKTFDCLTKLSDVIVVGSPFLADLVSEDYKKKVLLLSTTDGDMHHLLTKDVNEVRIAEIETVIKVVWVGTFSTLHYVERICEALEKAGLELAKQRKDLQLTVVCDKELEYKPLHFKLVNIKWEKQIAIAQMLQSHIGIMPLEDNESTRGKCGFKLIQYLSVGLPIIGSTIGFNKMIIKDSFGIGVKELDIDSWVEAIIQIVKESSQWRLFSENAYKEWEDKYNYTTNLSVWRHMLLK
jgi:glycosyltransferase involved in cell wall biosynthesis